MTGLAVEAARTPPDDWDAFLAGQGDDCVYHRARWVRFAGEVFGFDPCFLQARDAAGRLVGALPLVHQRSRLFGSRLVSLPFFNYGGAIAGEAGVRERLVAESAALARRTGAPVLEIRDRAPLDGVATRLDKVAMLLDLPPTFEALSKQLGSKLRSQVKRAERVSPGIVVGGAELVREFYAVFAPTMRDLGTPVYPVRFFSALMAACGADARIVIVRARSVPAAAGLLVRHGDVMEVPWAASAREFRADAVNMRLYWELLRNSIEAGCRRFDFGRSTVDAGTYRFKAQWGARPVQLHWLYPLEPAGMPPAAPGSGRAVRLAQAVWTRLPTPVANAVGGIVSPGLPW